MALGANPIATKMKNLCVAIQLSLKKPNQRAVEFSASSASSATPFPAMAASMMDRSVSIASGATCSGSSGSPSPQTP